MEQAPAPKKALRFGLFEVDFASQELRKSGIRIKLQDQPFQILALLLERPGEIVTREEIQKRLWAGDTFVDFDLGLNSAVKKLRQALGDESDNPRFVETLYRRGYRFLAPVQNGNSAPVTADPNSAPPPANGHSVQDTGQRAGSHGDSALRHGSSSRKIALYLALPLLLALGLLAGYGLRLPSPPRITAYQQVTRDGRQKYGVLTDGERLYLAEYEGGRFAIAQVSAAGGETSLLPTPFTNVMLGNIVPDGSSLFVGEFHETNKQSPVWSLPLPTGAPRRVAGLVAESLAPSPDGKWLVFSTASEIYQAAMDGTQVKKLFSTKGPTFDLAFSPDSQRLVFTVSDTQAGTNTLWTANRDGSGLRTLFLAADDSQHDSAARWTPDGKYLLFQRYREGHFNVWVLPLAESWFGHKPQPVQLTNGPLDFQQPVPSRDGKKFFAIGAQPRTELVRSDGKSGFKSFLGGLSITDVAFSADGQWVTYVTVPDNSLWRSRIDGSERLQLTDPGKIVAGLPRWSPDARQIVFMGKTTRSNWRAYLISSNGGTFQDLVSAASAGLDPNWMPNGKSIVVSLGNLGHTGQGVSLVDLQSGKVRDLPGGERYFSPRPSPDGKYIAAVTTDSGTLALFDLATQRWTDLVKLPIGYPSWSHDGQYLYFDSILSEDPAYYRVRISDHKLERLVSLAGIRRFWGEMAQWAGLAPDDSLLLTRDASNQEVYSLDWLPE